MNVTTKEEYWKLADEAQQNLISMARRAGILTDVAQLIKDRNVAKLTHVLNYIWFRLPESESTRRIAGFFDLCTLCSEVWVFDERKEEDECN